MTSNTPMSFMHNSGASTTPDHARTASVTTTFAIDSSAVGRVIGTRGASIRTIREAMGVGGYIRVNPQKHTCEIPATLPENRKIKIPILGNQVTFVVPRDLAPGGALEVNLVLVSSSAPHQPSAAVITAARAVIRSAIPPFMGHCACPAEFAPMLIGRGGSRLKEFQREVGAGCRIFYNRARCVFDIQAATAENLETAINLLLEKIGAMSGHSTSTFISLDDEDLLG